MPGTLTGAVEGVSADLGNFAGGSDFAWVFVGIVVIVVFSYIAYYFVTETWGE